MAGRGIPRIGEVLADKFRADNLAVFLNQAAIGPMRKEKLREPGHSERIDKPVMTVIADDHHDSGADLSQHGFASSGKADGGDSHVDAA